VSFNAHQEYALRNERMSFSDFLLWPGTKICERMGVDPEADAGLIRSMFNMLVYLTVSLGVAWFILG
jgi:hypothetical protein